MELKLGRLRSALAWTGGVLWVLAPLAVVALLVFWSQQVRFTDAVRTWSPVRASTATTQTPAELAVGWSQGPIIRAPAWHGLVTATPAAGKSSVSAGDVIVSIDGIDRIAAVTPGPFWRTLEAGTPPGRDIGWLNTVLGDLGLRHCAGRSFCADTAAGVSALAKRLGAGSDVIIFDPTWLVRIPEPTLGVGDAKFSSGQPAPELGAELFSPRFQANAALVTGAGQAPHPAEVRGDPNAAPPPPTALDARAVPRLSVDPDARVLVGGTELALGDDRSSLSAGGLTTLNDLVDPGEAVVRVTIEHPAQAEGWTVPAAAVYTTGVDQHCVLTPTGPVVVSVVTSEGSSVTVTGNLSADERVLLAVPARERTCPSP